MLLSRSDQLNISNITDYEPSETKISPILHKIKEIRNIFFFEDYSFF
ncbi:hypothetical protein RIEPE_0308 [Candidatus Riesia pediculicola USDA]|uniref:Uncharacterized protein n=1 Tax=Riesia pediculicola (strain USDA) TaxID=515618 RepID=D4G8A2_RIEPU|nr:hypothetical protein RIEPE_0308 [Candidatus Riesia pediculicola USDA]